MKRIVMGIALLGALSAAARPQFTTNGLIRVGDKEISPEELRAKVREVQQKKTGGIIRQANSAKGVFVVLNGQKRIATKTLRTIEPMIDKWLRVQMAFMDTAPATVATAKEAVKAAGGTVGVAVVDDEALPALLPAPEDGWAIVNVQRLAADKPDEALLAERTRKEILRGLAFITGCAYATRADHMMRDVRQPSDLDPLKGEVFGAEIISIFLRSAPLYGLTPWRQATYLNACQSGWAPAPTNECQKAIWESVHAPPEKPLKITYDKDKQKPVVK